MIFPEQRVIFIHYPKTGGNSIQYALRNHTPDRIVARTPRQDGYERFDVLSTQYKKLWKHSTLEEYYDAIGSDLFNYKIFITIRNPFDRLVSYYFSPHRGNVIYSRADFYTFIGKVAPLTTFINLQKFSSIGENILNCITFLKFESLSKDFLKLTAELGLKNITLPHRNRGSRGSYHHYYDDELITVTRVLHNFELNIGGYSFDDNKSRN